MVSRGMLINPEVFFTGIMAATSRVNTFMDITLYVYSRITKKSFEAFDVFMTSSISDFCRNFAVFGYGKCHKVRLKF